MFLGIDTSCYTTSMAVVDREGNIICDHRKVLDVEKGQRGLQQSNAVFQHIKNIPIITEKLFSEVDSKNIQALAISYKPRPVKESYMPVFAAGINSGEVIANTLGIKAYQTTHQEGHLMAGFYPNKPFVESTFLAIHLSGGTSEVLKVKYSNQTCSFHEEIIGGSLDLHGGQFVDRVGVALGLEFPCGKKLEEISRKSFEEKVKLTPWVKDCNFSFSGPESQAQRAINNGAKPEDVAMAVQKCIASTILKIIVNSVQETGITNILIVGGVAANQFLRYKIMQYATRESIKVHFGMGKYCTDNGVGVALIAKEKALKKM
ncbi:N6-L-threonylcarbamoyladenine synthase [Desulfitispora alkaliphila]|uniref:Kae1-like domain-containing protein n=1 Tax=Desulfitispora alkaliphila TaxID=622674 RepID=UPI003D24528E